MRKKCPMGFYCSWHWGGCRNLVLLIKDVGSCHFLWEKSPKPVHLRKLPCFVTQHVSCGDFRWSTENDHKCLLCPASVVTLQSHQPLCAAGLQLHCTWDALCMLRQACADDWLASAAAHSQETAVWYLSRPAREYSSVITELQEPTVVESQNSLAYKTNPSVNSPQFNKS